MRNESSIGMVPQMFPFSQGLVWPALRRRHVSQDDELLCDRSPARRALSAVMMGGPGIVRSK